MMAHAPQSMKRVAQSMTRVESTRGRFRWGSMGGFVDNYSGFIDNDTGASIRDVPVFDDC
jgi:hypothetical protein